MIKQLVQNIKHNQTRSENIEWNIGELEVKLDAYKEQLADNIKEREEKLEELNSVLDGYSIDDVINILLDK